MPPFGQSPLGAQEESSSDAEVDRFEYLSSELRVDPEAIPRCNPIGCPLGCSPRRLGSQFANRFSRQVHEKNGGIRFRESGQDLESLLVPAWALVVGLAQQELWN